MNISVMYKIYHRSCDWSTRPAWGCSKWLVRAQLYAKSDGWIAEEGRVLRRPLGGLRKNLRLRFAGRKGKPQCAPVGWIWQLSDKVRLQPVDGLRRKVGFCDEYATGVYYVLDCCGAGARREITRKPPPQVRFSTKIKTLIIN